VKRRFNIMLLDSGNTAGGKTEQGRLRGTDPIRSAAMC
jgi:hypothetical protein